MSTLIVADSTTDWPLADEGVSVVAARTYLTDPAHGEDRGARVINLSRSYRYQSLGYYVSLLAEARGHKVLPRAGTIEDVHSPRLVRILTDELAELVEQTLAKVEGDRFELSVYFGATPSQGCAVLAKQLFSLLQAPLLRACFEREGGHWRTRTIRLVGTHDIGAADRPFAMDAARRHLRGRTRSQAPGARHDVAILHNPQDSNVASNPAALAKFAEAAEGLGMRAEFITAGDFARLPEFDALFIRDTTFVHHYTYRFARRAAAEGLVVIDDPDSILKCNNKVYLAELLARHKLPAPRTLVVCRDNIDQIVPTLSLPCVLKQPDSSFSVGVERVDDEAALAARVAELLGHSDLIVAQEWMPTEFDWRVGVLDGRAIFVCKYWMAKGHWQIIDHNGAGGREEGPVETLAVGEAPEEVVRLAVQAACHIGDGFYGIDIKQVGNRYCIVEINDNPNVDAGNEDAVLKDALYREVMGVFLRRLAQRRRGEVP